ENRMKGRVSAVCSRPVWPSPTPSSSTATIGAAASAICSADCADRFDQARRLKVEGKREGSETGIGMLPHGVGCTMWEEDGLSHPISDNACDARVHEAGKATRFPMKRWTASELLQD